MAAALRSTQSSAQSIKATIEILKHGKKPEWEDNMVEVLHNYFVPETKYCQTVLRCCSGQKDHTSYIQRKNWGSLERS